MIREPRALRVPVGWNLKFVGKGGLSAGSHDYLWLCAKTSFDGSGYNGVQ